MTHCLSQYRGGGSCIMLLVSGRESVTAAMSSISDIFDQLYYIQRASMNTYGVDTV